MKKENSIIRQNGMVTTICAMISVFVSVFAVVQAYRNTDKIIDNENKENHRPLIELEYVDDYSFESLNTYQYFVFSNEYHTLTGSIDEASDININTALKKVTLKNIGSGPAVNVHFVDFLSNSNDKYGNFAYNIATISNLSSFKIGVNGHKSVYLNLNYVIKSSEIEKIYNSEDIKEVYDDCFILIWYEDLYGNAYNSIMDFTFSKRKILKNYIDMNSTIKKSLLLDKDYNYYSNKEYLVVDTMTYSLYDEGSWEYEYLMKNIQHRDINKILSPFIN